MISWALMIDDLIKTLENYKSKGIMHVGVKSTTRDCKVYLDMVQMELVYVDKDGNYLGDEAEDYKPKEGEIPAMMIS